MTYISGQAGADFSDGTRLPTSTFDDTITSSSVAGSGGTWTREIDIDTIETGLVQIVEVDISAGTSADTTFELYDADPSGAGVLIYQVQNLDIPGDGAHSDPNVWWTEVAVAGSIWAKITNDGGSATTYTVRLRIRNDNTVVFTE
jgi:hypothetical protein